MRYDELINELISKLDKKEQKKFLELLISDGTIDKVENLLEEIGVTYFYIDSLEEKLKDFNKDFEVELRLNNVELHHKYSGSVEAVLVPTYSIDDWSGDIYLSFKLKSFKVTGEYTKGDEND